MDYGILAKCCFDDLRKFYDEASQFTDPPKCFECRLAEVQPSMIRSSCNVWDENAVNFLRETVQSGNDETVVKVSV